MCLTTLDSIIIDSQLDQCLLCHVQMKAYLQPSKLSRKVAHVQTNGSYIAGFALQHKPGWVSDHWFRWVSDTDPETWVIVCCLDEYIILTSFHIWVFMKYFIIQSKIVKSRIWKRTMFDQPKQMSIKCLTASVTGSLGTWWRAMKAGGQRALWRDPNIERLRMYCGRPRSRGLWREVTLGHKAHGEWGLCEDLRDQDSPPTIENSHLPVTQGWGESLKITHISTTILPVGQGRGGRAQKREEASRWWPTRLKTTLEVEKQKAVHCCR